MNDHANIAGAAASIDFEIGTTACKLRPITFADQFEYEEWVRTMTVKLLCSCDNLTLEQKTTATMQAMGMGWFSEPCIQSTGTKMGKGMLLWLATRASHGNTLNWLRDNITEEQLHAGDRLLTELTWGGKKKG